MAESKRNNHKYKNEWRAAKEGHPVKSEFEKQEQIASLTRQILAAVAAVFFSSVMFGWHHMSQAEGISGPVFQLKVFYIGFAQHLAFPFTLAFLLIGYVHLKEKLYLSGPVLMLCSLAFLWMAKHQI